MEITKIVENDIVLFEIKGNLDTTTAPDAETEINKTLIENPGKVIIDLGQTEYVSSAGLRIFLATAKKLGASGGKLRLCSANETVKDVLEMSGFVTFLELLNSRAEALNWD